MHQRTFSFNFNLKSKPANFAKIIPPSIILLYDDFINYLYTLINWS